MIAIPWFFQEQPAKAVLDTAAEIDCSAFVTAESAAFLTKDAFQYFRGAYLGIRSTQSNSLFIGKVRRLALSGDGKDCALRFHASEVSWYSGDDTIGIPVPQLQIEARLALYQCLETTADRMLLQNEMTKGLLMFTWCSEDIEALLRL